ncbi:MAG: Holliday junction branch migration protein RuvA [Coriobacteriaceae bacterium]|nr:Holliday junction branch migration protein RuvA [Coriobacteriaceae bacterium]
MIAYLKGTVVSKGAEEAVIEVAGIGYRLGMSAQAISHLPAVGSTAQVYTYLQLKDDGIFLYGFVDEAERAFFEKLIGISGIGPKIALAALSAFPLEELSAAVAQGDVSLIATIPGIGKKTAQRVVLEMQGALKDLEPVEGAALSGAAYTEAQEALASMGFASAEVAGALRGYDGDDADVSAVIRYALHNLGGAA